MSSFKEEFPSLKGHVHTQWYDDISPLPEDEDVYEGCFVYVGAIKRDCLDKQRVREAIKYIRGHIPTQVRNLDAANHSNHETRLALDMMVKELGLEDNDE